MFQSLSPNQQLYILHKTGTPNLEIGTVQNVSPPKQDPLNYGQMPTQSVDVTVLVNGQTLTYTLPAMAVVGTLRGNGSIVVSMSREAMSNEIKNLRQVSVDALNSIDFHKGMVAKCDQLWQDLNPEAREKEQQKQEINELKNQVSAMSSNMAQLMEMNRKLMEKLDGEKTNKSKKQEQ